MFFCLFLLLLLCECVCVCVCVVNHVWKMKVICAILGPFFNLLLFIFGLILYLVLTSQPLSIIKKCWKDFILVSNTFYIIIYYCFSFVIKIPEISPNKLKARIYLSKNKKIKKKKLKKRRINGTFTFISKSLKNFHFSVSLEWLI